MVQAERVSPEVPVDQSPAERLLAGELPADTRADDQLDEAEPSPEPVSAAEELELLLELFAHRVLWFLDMMHSGDEAMDPRAFNPGRMLVDSEQPLDPDGPPAIPVACLTSRMYELAARADLDIVDVGLLLTAVAVNIEPWFETQYQVLNQDNTTRAPTVRTALGLLGYRIDDPAVRARLRGDAPLLRWGLVELSRPERALPSQLIVVSERVAAFLLGDDAIADSVSAICPPVQVPLLSAQDLPSLDAFHVPVGSPLVLRARSGAPAAMVSRRIMYDLLGKEALILRSDQLDPDRMIAHSQFQACLREATIAARGLVIMLEAEALPIPINELSRLLLDTEIPVIVCRADTEAGSWPGGTAEIEVPRPTREQRRAWWQWAAPGSDTDEIADASMQLTPEAIWEIVQAARYSDPAAAEEAGAHIPVARMRAAREGYGTGKISRLARRVSPAFTLQDVVLVPEIKERLTELRDRARWRSVVIDEWGMRPGGGRGRGVTAMFSGPSGTGKSMAAEALAGELGVPLFVVEIATLVDKYIGETEKNLEAVFTAVEQTDGILLFDEADALFGKRSGVSDARDRHANIEVAYLLQRMEAFDGLAILTTNMRANIDDAFIRRLDAAVDFPEPSPAQREQLWRTALAGKEIATDAQVISALATVPFAGGSIRSAAVAAAFLAAADGSEIGRRHLVRGVHREWQKQGRLELKSPQLEQLELETDRG